MVAEPITAVPRSALMASAPAALPGWPLPDAAISAGLVTSAELMPIVAASVPVKNVPPAVPLRSKPAAWAVLVDVISVEAIVSSWVW